MFFLGVFITIIPWVLFLPQYPVYTISLYHLRLPKGVLVIYTLTLSYFVLLFLYQVWYIKVLHYSNKIYQSYFFYILQNTLRSFSFVRLRFYFPCCRCDFPWTGEGLGIDGRGHGVHDRTLVLWKQRCSCSPKRVLWWLIVVTHLWAPQNPQKASTSLVFTLQNIAYNL